MFLEIEPSDCANNLIDAFWISTDNESNEIFKVLPDTCAGLIIDLNQNKGFIPGIMSNFQTRKLGIKSDVMGIRFKA